MTFRTSLVLQRLLKIVRASLQRAIRLGAADGDHRLFGECLQQFNLAVREAAGFAAAKGKPADRHTTAHHRDRNYRSHLTVMREFYPWLRIEIVDADDPTVHDCATH